MHKNLIKKILILFPLISFLLISICFSLAFAFGLELENKNFDTEGTGSLRNLTIYQDIDTHTAIEIYIKKRAINEKGEDILTDLENEDIFYLSPQQILLKPQDKQVINIRYTGPIDIKTEEAYRIILEEIPINLDEKKPVGKDRNIRLKHIIQKAFYVCPKETRPNLEISYLGNPRESTANSAVKLEITIKNSGNSHLVVKRCSLKLKEKNNTQKDWVVIIPTEIQGKNFLANSYITTVIPWPAEITKTDLIGEFVLEESVL